MNIINNNSTPDQLFLELTKLILETGTKKHLEAAFKKLPLSQQIKLLEYTNTKTSDQFYRYIRNHAENLAR